MFHELFALIRGFTSTSQKQFYPRGLFRHSGNVLAVWTGEEITGFLLPATLPGTIPLYRLVYCCAALTIHHWTTDPNEKNVLTAPGGAWSLESSPGNLYPVVAGAAITGKSAPVPWSLAGEEAAHRKSAETLLSRQTSRRVTTGQPVIAAVLNAASFEPTPLSPGETIRVVGDNLLRSRLIIGGTDARILSATNAKILAVVPATLSQADTSVLRVEKNGASVEKALRIADSSVAVFARDAFGKGDAVVNGPVSAGGQTTLYATGLRAGTEVSVWIGGVKAEVLSVTSGPDAAGRTAIEVRVPPGLEAGQRLPVTLASGASSSQLGVNIVIE